MDGDVMVFKRPSLPNLDDLALEAHRKNNTNTGNIMENDGSFYGHIKSVSFDSRYAYPSALDFLDVNIDENESICHNHFNAEKSTLNDGNSLLNNGNSGLKNGNLLKKGNVLNSTIKDGTSYVNKADLSLDNGNSNFSNAYSTVDNGNSISNNGNSISNDGISTQCNGVSISNNGLSLTMNIKTSGKGVDKRTATSYEEGTPTISEGI
jgi:hypothetical protein